MGRGVTERDRAEAVERVYGQAVELPREERARFLNEACSGDPGLRNAVESLLERSADAESFFARLGDVVRIPPTDALPPRFETGDRVGPYEIEGELGRGGMGIVYRARDIRLGRAVALKFLPSHLSADPEAKTGLVAEAKAASATDHPNIATLYEIGEAPDGSLYLAMPCYQGQTLKERLAQGGSVPPAEARTIARQIAEGLAAAHRRGVIHRDVKPANVFLTEDGFVKLLDFGVAKLAESDVTQSGRAVGTAAYMSPEQARGERVDHRTDLWSLGVVLYEMITGRRPFQGEREAAVVRAILEDPAPAPAGPEGAAPSDLAAIVRRLLAKVPAERYGSAAEVVQDLASGYPRGRAAGWRRRPRWALPAVGAAAIAAALALIVFRPGEGEVASAEDARTVAVLPFEVRGDDEYAYLREGMVNLLSASLEGPAHLRVVPPSVLLSRYERESPERLTLEGAARFASVMGAGRFVLGEIVEVEGSLRIQASLYDRDRLDDPVATATVEGAAARLFNLVDELSAQLMLAPHEGPGGRMARAAAVSTTSLEAFKAYFDGERSLAAGDFDAAIEALQRATAADTAYALAYYRLAQAAGWDLRYRQAREAALAAQRHAARLAPHERLLVDALVALMERDVAGAERLYYQALSDRPDDVEAWHGLGEVLFHSNHLRGRSRDEARRPFERAMQLDPEHGESRFHLLQLAAWDRRRADFEAQYQTLPASERTSLEWRALRAFAFGDSVARAAVVDEMGRSEDRERYRAALRVASYARDLDAAAQLARLQIDGARLPEQRSEGLQLLSRIELARGRPRAARAVLMELFALDPAEARELRALFAALPFVPLDRAELDNLEREFTAWRPEPDRGAALRPYVLGLLDVRRGDRAGALSRAAELDAMGRDPVPDSLAQGYAAVLRAYVALREDDAAAALEHLEAAPWAITQLGGGTGAAFYARTLERYLKAEILQALGRSDEALGWYRSVAEFSSHGVPYMAPSALREAEQAARIGDEALAVERYRRFLAMWGGAEPELQPIAQAARRRLTGLVVE